MPTVPVMTILPDSSLSGTTTEPIAKMGMWPTARVEAIAKESTAMQAEALTARSPVGYFELGPAQLPMGAMLEEIPTQS